MRERVIRAITFEEPDKVPLEISYDVKTLVKYENVLNELLLKYPNHMLLVWYSPEVVRFLNAQMEEFVDWWGVVWTRRKMKVGYRVKKHPLEKWEDLEHYTFPNVEELFEFPEKTLKNSQGRYTVGTFHTLFEGLWFLRGLNNVLVDLMRKEERLSDLADKIVEFNIKSIKRWLELGVDAIYFSDDYGFQDRLMMPPMVWRSFFKPRLAKEFQAAHKGGAHTILHSDGNIEEIISDLIEIGLDVLNPVQPQAMNIDRLGERYAGKICFWGGVNVQRTLPFGSPEDIKHEVRHLISTLGKREGGYIGGTSHTILFDTPLQNIRAMYEAFERYGSIC